MFVYSLSVLPKIEQETFNKCSVRPPPPPTTPVLQDFSSKVHQRCKKPGLALSAPLELHPTAAVRRSKLHLCYSFRSPTRIGSIGISFRSTVWLLLAPFKTTNARPFLLWIIYHGNLPWHAELHIWHICQSSQHKLPQSWVQVRLAGLASRMPTIHVLSPNRLLRAKQKAVLSLSAGKI